MGFLDKAKSQMANATAMAKDAAQKGQAKLNTMQAKKRADALLRDLGATVFAQQVGRAAATAEADVSRIVGQLHAHEAEHGQIDLGLEADGQAATAGGAGAPVASTGVPAASTGVPTSSGVPAASTGVPTASTGIPPSSSVPASSSVPTASTEVPTSSLPGDVPTSSLPPSASPG